jgi:hypothetical protein
MGDAVPGRNLEPQAGHITLYLELFIILDDL